MKTILLGTLLVLGMSRPGCGGEDPPGPGTEGEADLAQEAKDLAAPAAPDLSAAVDMNTAVPQDMKVMAPDMRLPTCGTMTASCGTAKFDFSVPTKWGSCRMQVPCTPTSYWQDYERMMVQECTDVATGMKCAKSYWQPMSGCFPMCNK